MKIHTSKKSKEKQASAKKIHFELLQFMRTVQKQSLWQKE